jgi:5'-phosphate synthase pdxT subunit
VALADAISGYIAAERPVFGTCAGLILLAREVDGRNELHYSALDISVERNSYGSQVESFEADLDIDLGTEKVGSFPAVFIRAPRIVSCGSSVRIHGSFNGDPVLVSQGKIFAATFHPELTDDPRLHRYFIELGTRGS